MIVCVIQTSGNVSHLETQIASLQQALLQAKNLMHVKLQDAVAGHRQADKTVKVFLSMLHCTHHAQSI